MNYKHISSHFNEELIEERHFGRLSPSDTQLFDLHARLCQSCAVKLHNERMFIYAMQAALERPEPFENRDGATFREAAAYAAA
jgi:hypothetical protein